MAKKKTSFDSAQDDKIDSAQDDKIDSAQDDKIDSAQDKQDQQNHKINPITNTLIEAFLKQYEPAEPNDNEAEQYTTLDLIDQMAPIADVEKWEINTALTKAGFKLKYATDTVFWVIKKR